MRLTQIWCLDASSIAFLAVTVSVAALSVVLLTSCGEQPKTATTSTSPQGIQQHQARLRADQEKVLQLAQQIEQVKQKREKLIADARSEAQKISALTTDSDKLWRQAQLAQRKDDSSKSSFDKDKLKKDAEKAQQLADAKAAELMDVRRSITSKLTDAATLNEQIQTITAEKKAASHLAQLEAHSIQSLAQPGQAGNTATLQTTDEKASFETAVSSQRSRRAHRLSHSGRKRTTL